MQFLSIRRSIGSVSSKPVASVVEEFERGLREGYRDFTILGDDPGSYDIDLKSSLPELLQALFAAGVEAGKPNGPAGSAGREIAFHLNEIHPKFLIAYAEKLLAMEHFSSIHSILSPVQSGSSRVPFHRGH